MKREREEMREISFIAFISHFITGVWLIAAIPGFLRFAESSNDLRGLLYQPAHQGAKIDLKQRN
jgi:hypothetical protein